MVLEEERINNKFRPVLREINALRRKIYKKEGFIFIEHSYSIDELLSSMHHQKIDSITQKIGDDIENWYNEGKLNKIEEKFYYLKRNEVENELEDINIEIENREPTWWENIKGSMTEFVSIVMNNLPEVLQRKLLSNFEKVFKSLGFNNPLNQMKLLFGR